MGVMREPASQRVGRYEVLEYLGSGGMSDVYAALHTGLRKRVALKVLRSSLRHDEDAVQRFLREGECAARVCHPNVVNVHDVGVEDGVPYLVMELLTGETLDQKLAREGTLPYEQALELLLPIFDAVDQVHRSGVVHRDVKPSNILLACKVDGSITPKLVDFGVATLDERRLITGAIGPIGTPTYMSPEQARGLDPVDGRSDQYALASILFELVTGREAFPGADIESVLSNVARGQFPRLSQVLRAVPRGLDEVLARATSYHARDRFGSVREFAEALLPFVGRHVRDAWRENDGVACETSGARFSMTVAKRSDSHTTLRVRTSQPNGIASAVPFLGRSRARPPESLRQKRTVIAGIGALALALGLVVGVAHSRGQWAANEPVPTVQPMRAAALAEPAIASSRPLAAQAGPLTIRVTPSYADSMLDGQALGRGDLRIANPQENKLHELRVSALGHVTRVVLFRGAPGQLSVQLEPAAP